MSHLSSVPPGIVGRGQPLSRIASSIGTVDEGGAAILLTGEAGAGKTTLVEAAAGIATAAGWAVLTCTGVESETQVGFAGLHELLHPVVDRADDLPAPYRDTLLSVFGLGPRTAPDRLLLSTAVFTLLADLAARQPLLVVLDDAHWMDHPTINLIGYLANRVTGVPIVMLVTRRPGEPEALPALGLDEIRLDRLTDADARTLVRQRRPGLDDHLVERVVDEAEGNPLALVELSRDAADRGRRSPAAPAVRTSPRTRLERGYAGQVAALSPQAQDVLLLAATNDEPALPELLAAARRLDLGADAVEESIGSGLITTSGTRVRFRHPLIRSVVRRTAGLHRRIQVHQALAHVLTTDDPSRAAWHRAAATIGADEPVAHDLEEAAGRELARGVPGAAMRSLQRAAQLSPAADDRGRRLAQAAEAARLAGLPDATRRLSAQATAGTGDVRVHSAVAMTAMALDVSTGTRTCTPDGLLDQALRAARAGHLDPAIDLISCAAVLGHMISMPAEPRERIDRELAGLAVPDADLRSVIARSVLAPARYAQTTGPVVRAFARDTAALPAALATGLAVAAEALQEWSSAALLWQVAADRYRVAGAMTDHSAVRSRLGFALLAEGRLAEAAAESGAVLRDAHDAGLPLAIAFASAVTASVRAWQDDVPGTPAAGGEPIRADVGSLQDWAAGVAALARGRTAQAFALLRATAVHPDVAVLAIADLAEAAHGDAEAEEHARSALAAVQRRVGPAGSLLTTLVIRRSQALLGPDGDAGHLLVVGTAGADRYPLQIARARLMYGVHLRRTGRPERARAELTAAATTFAEAGATAWVNRAHLELRACGAVIATPTGDRRSAIE
ncbi:ATP-binding protein [Actinoplanes rectilineatus]|uniref:ATP-binding protein n=1 Tax=Actinoplanes rectilineatus TaxID=113571 RepID=UPI0005F2B730|nr:AAA family ATPase [Actinoplanes rectilineatus]